MSITEEQINTAVLDGHYILQAYATTHWLDHVKKSIRGDLGSADFDRLSQNICDFLATRDNKEFDKKSVREEGVLELKKLEKKDEKTYRQLCYINSSLALELSESLEPTKKNSESPSFLCAAK